MDWEVRDSERKVRMTRWMGSTWTLHSQSALRAFCSPLESINLRWGDMSGLKGGEKVGEGVFIHDFGDGTEVAALLRYPPNSRKGAHGEQTHK